MSPCTLCLPKKIASVKVYEFIAVNDVTMTSEFHKVV